MIRNRCKNTLDKFPSFGYRLSIVGIRAPIYIGLRALFSQKYFSLSESGYPGFEDLQNKSDFNAIFVPA
jgi:hypothetical protein